MNPTQRPALDEQLARQLPLPLAQLYRRAHNAKTARDRHDAAYYLWEAALKLLGSVAVVAFADRRVADPKLIEVLKNLARPALGHWWEFVRHLLPVLGEHDPAFAGVRDLVLGRNRDDLPYCAGLDVALVESLEGKTGARATVRVLDLFNHLVSYRNREYGHGAAGQKPPAFYDRMGRALLAGMGELLAKWDVLAGRRLVYLAEVRRLGDGSWLVERGDLSREMYQRLESLAVTDEAAELPRPERLYLAAPGTGVLTPLHPLLVYDPEGNDVSFLNSRRGKKGVEYLSYTTGGRQERDGLGGEQRELLRRVLDAEVDAAAVEVWAGRSRAEDDAAGGEHPAADAGRPLGDFERLSELGRGGMGVVYRAWQPSLGRQVALKCLFRGGDPKAEARFRREIHALGRVEHPHLVKIFTSGSDGDQWFYAMELIEGATLASVCERLQTRGSRARDIDLSTWCETVSVACAEARKAETPLTRPAAGEPTAGGRSGAPPAPPPVPVPAAAGTTSAEPDVAIAPPGSRGYARHMVELVKQVAEATHALHGRGIIHRDIKPDNIMVSADGASACLMDLGLAQLADEVEGRLTRTRQFVGTLRYASPEQMLAVNRLDPASDVYSLGATLWELLTLQPLYGATQATPDVELMRRIQFDDPGRLRRFNPAVPRDLEAIVGKCLQKDPRRRYDTARELAKDLDRFLKGKPVKARPVGGLQRAWMWVKRRPEMAVLFLLASGVVASLIAGGLWYNWAKHNERVAAEMTDLRQAAVEEKHEAQRQRELAEQKAAEARRQQGLAEKSKEEEEKQRALAEAKAKEAKDQRDRAEANEKEAKKQQDRAERLQYAADMNLAKQAFQENRVFRMRELLLRHEKAEHHKGFEWHYLWQLCRLKLVRGPDHTMPTRAVAFSPDGRRAVSGSDDGTLKVWDAATGRELLAIGGHERAVQAVAFHPAGRVLVSVGDDGTVKGWDGSTGANVYTIPKAAEGSANSLAFTPDGRFVCFAGAGNSIRVNEAATGRPVGVCRFGHTAAVTGVAVSPDGKLLASASRDRTVKLWDADRYEVVPRLEGATHRSDLTDVAFSPDGRTLASSDESGEVIIWELGSGRGTFLRPTVKSLSPVDGLAFSPDGRRLMAVSRDGTTKIYDVGGVLPADVSPPTVLYGSGGVWSGGAFSPDGTRLVLGGDDTCGQVWDLTVDDAAATVAGWGTAEEVDNLAQTTDGRWLAYGAGANVSVRDAITGRVAQTFVGHLGPVRAVAFSPDGKWLVSGGKDGVVRVWLTDAGMRFREFTDHKAEITALAYHPTRPLVASADRAGLIRLWNPTTALTVRPLDAHAGEGLLRLAFSPDGGKLVTASRGKVVVWDTNTWEVIHTWTYNGILGVAFAPDGFRTATAMLSGPVLLHDDRRDDPVFRLIGHNGIVPGLAFSPDGRRLVSGGFDRTIRVWDLETGQPLITLRGEVQPVLGMAFSPDGRRLAVRHERGVQIWFAADWPGAREPVPQRWLNWHRDQARDCRRARLPFALAFHCARLLEVGDEFFTGNQPKELEPAEAELTAALEANPSRRDALTVRAAVRSRLKRWADVIDDCTEAIKLDDTSPATWWLRGFARAELGEWDAARADLARALDRAPTSRRELYNLLLAHLAGDDRAAARRVVAVMFDRLGGTDWPTHWNSVAWAWSLVPDGPVPAARAVELIDRAVAAQPKNYAFLNTRGAVLYRAGRYQDAITQLEKAVEIHGGGGSFDDWVYLAMAQHRLGRADEARQSLQKAIALCDQQLKPPAPGQAGANWVTRAEYGLLRREAEALLDVNRDAPGP